MNYCDEKQVLGEDEMMDGASTDHEEAPYDGDVVMPGVIASNAGIPSVNLRPRHCNRASQ